VTVGRARKGWTGRVKGQTGSVSGLTSVNVGPLVSRWRKASHRWQIYTNTIRNNQDNLQHSSSHLYQQPLNTLHYRSF